MGQKSGWNSSGMRAFSSREPRKPCEVPSHWNLEYASNINMSVKAGSAAAFLILLRRRRFLSWSCTVLIELYTTVAHLCVPTCQDKIESQLGKFSISSKK